MYRIPQSAKQDLTLFSIHHPKVQPPATQNSKYRWARPTAPPHQMQVEFQRVPKRLETGARLLTGPPHELRRVDEVHKGVLTGSMSASNRDLRSAPSRRPLARNRICGILPTRPTAGKGTELGVTGRSRYLLAMLYLIYRSSGATNLKNRPEFFDKSVALGSFLRAAEGIDTPHTVLFLNDGPIPEDRARLMRGSGRVVELPGLGNSGSYLKAVAEATAPEFAEADLVLLSEDDYLYLPAAFRELVTAAEAIPEASYFTLYDHRDRYTRTDDADGARARVYLAGDRHWRTVESTCMSYGARVGRCEATPRFMPGLAAESSPRIARCGGGFRGTAGAGCCDRAGGWSRRFPPWPRIWRPSTWRPAWTGRRWRRTRGAGWRRDRGEARPSRSRRPSR